MNAAFLLVTSACLAGQAAPAPAAPAAPIVASACGSSCGDACGCDSFGHRLRDKMQGLFHRGCKDACAPTTCGCGHSHKLFSRSCDTCNTCKPKIWTWQPKCRTHCAPAPTCCDACGGTHFLGRLKGIFHRNSGCCDGGCSTGCVGGACGAPAAAPAAGEKIEAPKKMPAPPVKEAGKQEVLFQTQPGTIPPIANSPSVIPNGPVAPNVEISPNPAPRIDGDRRDPF